MTPMAALECIDCGEDLRVEYSAPEPLVRCKHRVMREARGEGPCPLCAASAEHELERMLALNPVCTGCKEQEEAREAAQAAAEAARQRSKRSGMPGPLRGLRWADLVSTGKRGVAIAAALKWAQAPRHEARGLYLWGPAGTGKTRVASTAAWERLQAGEGLRWVSVAVLLTRLEASFSDKERQAALEVLTGDGPIVLDDIDKVNPSESKRNQLFAAIDRRVTAGNPMLVTGNLSPQQLESKLDAPIASRILGYSLGRTFELDGPDRRMTLDESA
jgi:chromosomal replication initiation ATPase DnaA